MDIAQQHRFLIIGRRAAVLAAALLLAACQTARPDFTERSRQDCERGDQEACRMLEALTPPEPPQTPHAARKPPPPRPTRVQTDVQAIIKGMEQARVSARGGYRENTPPPGAPSHEGPGPDSALPE